MGVVSFSTEHHHLAFEFWASANLHCDFHQYAFCVGCFRHNMCRWTIYKCVVLPTFSLRYSVWPADLLCWVFGCAWMYELPTIAYCVYMWIKVCVCVLWAALVVKLTLLTTYGVFGWSKLKHTHTVACCENRINCAVCQKIIICSWCLVAWYDQSRIRTQHNSSHRPNHSQADSCSDHEVWWF